MKNLATEKELRELRLDLQKFRPLTWTKLEKLDSSQPAVIPAEVILGQNVKTLNLEAAVPPGVPIEVNSASRSEGATRSSASATNTNSTSMNNPNGTGPLLFDAMYSGTNPTYATTLQNSHMRAPPQ